jgi:hypothetical protein
LFCRSQCQFVPFWCFSVLFPMVNIILCHFFVSTYRIIHTWFHKHTDVNNAYRRFFVANNVSTLLGTAQVAYVRARAHIQTYTHMVVQLEQYIDLKKHWWSKASRSNTDPGRDGPGDPLHSNYAQP